MPVLEKVSEVLQGLTTDNIRRFLLVALTILKCELSMPLRRKDGKLNDANLKTRLVKSNFAVKDNLLRKHNEFVPES